MPTIPAIKPCLWFHADAEAAANFYVALFPGSRVVSVMRAGPGADAPVIAVELELGGRPLMTLNGRREPGFTDAASLVVPCETQEEIDRYWDALIADGGAENRCGWLTDRFGVSWQIVPKDIGRLLGGDPAKAGRAMQAMMGMAKLDVAALERARETA